MKYLIQIKNGTQIKDVEELRAGKIGDLKKAQASVKEWQQENPGEKFRLIQIISDFQEDLGIEESP